MLLRCMLKSSVLCVGVKTLNNTIMGGMASSVSFWLRYCSPPIWLLSHQSYGFVYRAKNFCAWQALSDGHPSTRFESTQYFYENFMIMVSNWKGRFLYPHRFIQNNLAKRSYFLGFIYFEPHCLLLMLRMFQLLFVWNALRFVYFCLVWMDGSLFYAETVEDNNQ